MMVRTSVAAVLVGCLSFYALTGTAVAKESQVSDQLSSLTQAAQSAYTAALAEAANQYSKAMSAVSVKISGEPEPVQSVAYASVSSAYFDAIAGAQNIFQRAKANVVPEPTPAPAFDWEKIQALAQQRLDDSIKWANGQYEQAKVAIGAAEPTPTTPSEKAQDLLKQAQLNYYAGLGVAHDRYQEFMASVSSAASSWTAPKPTTTNVAERASESWDWLVAQVSDKVYGSPTPTAWYNGYYSQATRAPSAVSSLVSELLVGKEPTYTESILSRLASVYAEATATVSSVYSDATQAVDQMVDGAATALSDAGKVVLEQIEDLTEKVAGQIGGDKKTRAKDEL